jgi:stage II sporulation protein M
MFLLQLQALPTMNQINETNQPEPRRIKLTPHIILASIIFIICIAAGLILPAETMGQMIEEMQAVIEMLESLSPVALLLLIFLNNAIKCMFVVFLGILLGVPPVIFVCYNAYTIGALVAVLGPELGYGIVTASLLPHGIIELPVLVFSAALGLSIGAEVWKYLTRQESQVKKQLRFSLNIYFRWLILALFVAAIIEVFITPLIVTSSGFVPPI